LERVDQNGSVVAVDNVALIGSGDVPGQGLGDGAEVESIRAAPTRNGTEDNCIRVVVELERVLAAATREIIYSNDRTDDDETERRSAVVGAAGDVPGHGIGPGTEIEGVGAEASLDGAADEGVGVRAKIEPVIAGTAGEVLNRLVVADDEDSPDDVALVGPGDGPDQRTGVIAQIELIK